MKVLQISSLACSLVALHSISTAGAKSIRGSIKNDDSNVERGSVSVGIVKNTEGDLKDADTVIDDHHRHIAPRTHGRDVVEMDRTELRRLSYDGQGIPQDILASQEYDWVARRDPRIIGGSQAASGRYRYSVSLQDRIGHFCGGSLISPDVVLSAAHCAGGSYDVVIDRPNLNSNNSGQKVAMKRERQHPNYNSKTTNNDFMLVFLDKPVNMNGGINVVEINSDPNYPNVGQKVTVMGYGDTNPSDNVSDLSDKLMEVEVKVISNDDCDDSSGSIGGYQDSYNGQISSSMICTKEVDKDACQGDSGGPLVVKGSGNKDMQIGVVSWGIGCATRHFPGVYARISEEYDWIRNEVCDNSVNPPASFDCDGSAGGNNGGGGNNSGGGNGGTSGNGGSGSGNDSGSGSGNGSGGSGKWDGVFGEDFGGGMGRFEDTVGARFIKSSKGKDGVVRIQRSARMDTDWYTAKKYSQCQAKVSFMMVGMEKDDDWCVEYSSDGNNNFRTAKCFTPDEFKNKRWYEGQAASFSVDGLDDIKIRLLCRGNSRKDDVYINDVELECQ